MSTKINGYVTKTGSFLHFNDRLNTFRAEARPLALRLLAKHLVDRAVRMLDCRAAGVSSDFETNTRPLISKLFYEYEEERRANLAKRFCDRLSFDVDFDAQFIPISEKKTLVLPFTEQNDLKDAFIRIFGLEPYAYWDGTDRPDDVSEAQWRQRKNDWTLAIGPDFTPANHGVGFKLLDSFFTIYDLSRTDIVSLVAPFEDRLRELAINTVIAQRMKDAPPDQAIRVIWNFKPNSEANKPIIEETIEKNRSKLKPVIELKDLSAAFSPNL